MIHSEHHHKRYMQFINSLRGQFVNGYAELHHIVPKSLGGSDDVNNLIRLTARQHYIAHWMLARAIKGSAARAFFMMSNFGKYGKVNSATYQIARKEYAQLVGEQMRGRIMPPITEETREKQRQAKLGKRLSLEHIEKVRQSRIGKPLTDQWKANLSASKRGKTTRGTGWNHSEETIKRVAESNRNRPMITCPHCTKTVKDHGGAKRWHFDRCKERIDMNDKYLIPADGEQA